MLRDRNASDRAKSTLVPERRHPSTRSHDAAVAADKHAYGSVTVMAHARSTRSPTDFPQGAYPLRARAIQKHRLTLHPKAKSSALDLEAQRESAP